MPHREIDPSQPVLYENAVGAYRHFFGASPPTDCWPPLPAAVERPAVDGEEEDEEGHGQAAEGEADASGRRRAFVRSTEEKFHFTKEKPKPRGTHNVTFAFENNADAK